ncbi:hypothetical protein [Pseudoalteromonas marina]|jgi:hypothetical protein|uniref:Uncharacterized protein n=1 Tax=Pseudoalteromonas marina TaxID=267375 RepID=A0ABT9FHQ5_9GAMM|nr:hypothetical protein [Pseudoalteromonas marina]KAF7776924.1 hypothetical protein PMAN_a2112 [Pseudoalteromonas marina]MDP2566318.1 hypothetical protein [Pseudoalteromonas marina]
MKPFIKFEQVWCDDDITELRVTVNNGYSIFSNKVYLAATELAELHESLLSFRTHYYGGLKDIDFGAFGSEYANGAFSARLHFPKPGNLHISTMQQSEFFDFKGKEVASEAKMYLITEPTLLDNFINELKSLSTMSCKEAELVCT